MDKRIKTGRTVGLALLALVVSLPFTAAAHASENDWQEWTTFRINVPMPSTRWSFGVWNQARFNDDIGRFNWLLINPSLHYKLSKHWKVGFGMQYIVKNSADDETMPWQEISLSHKFGNHLVLGNRFRLEERFIQDAAGMVFRSRYRINVSYPIRDTRFYLTGSEAVWANLNEQNGGPDTGFDQNRLFGGAGMHVGKQWRLEAGYLWRYKDNGDDPSNTDHVIMMQFFFDTKGKEKPQPTADEAYQ